MTIHQGWRFSAPGFMIGFDMLISTRGRYALRVLVDLVEQCSSGNVSLKDIAERQGISLKYMESIMNILSKSGMVVGSHGKKGGYKLAREPQEYRVGDILRLTEGSIAPVACVDCAEKEVCTRKVGCRTRPMWEKLNELITGYLDQVTLADLTRMDDGSYI